MEAALYTGSVAVFMAAFGTILAIAARSFNKRFDDINLRFDDHANSINLRFDDHVNGINNRFNDLADIVKANGEALSRLSEDVAVLSKDVAIIKDRMDRNGAAPSERGGHIPVDVHGMSEEPDTNPDAGSVPQDGPAGTDKGSESV